MPYLGPRALRKIQQYKYASGMYSFLDTRVMNPFWNFVVGLVPLGVAPNALTLAALSCAASSYALVVWHCPTLTEEAPAWVFAYAAVALFLYQTLDAIDGKQARRTGSASPLGQLFDHGCDAVAAVLSSVLVAAALRTGTSRLSILLLMMHLVPFFVKNWEACHTDYMRHDVVGVTEAQLTIIGVMAATAALGHDVWRAQMPESFPAVLGERVSVAAAVVAVTLLCAVWQTIESVLEVRRTLASRDRPQLERDNAWRQLGQFFFYTALSLAWVECPTTEVWHTHTHAVKAVIGLVFVYHVTLLIVAHVAGQAYPFWTPILAPFPLVVLNSYARAVVGVAFCDGLVLAVYGAFAGVVYLHYVCGIIGELCAHLGIHAFRITRVETLQSADYGQKKDE